VSMRKWVKNNLPLEPPRSHGSTVRGMGTSGPAPMHREENW